MNPQERDQLNHFLQQLTDVKLTAKDSEAEALIHDAITRQPDAAYLLVQRCLLQDRALLAAQSRITELQDQLKQQQTATSATGFLNDNPWATASAADNRVPGASNYQMPPRAVPGNMNLAQAAPQNQASGMGSSFLGNVATTAAGVVAGSFLFQGINNLLGNHHSPSPSQAQTGGEQHAAEPQPAEQTVINNYYGDADQAVQHADYNPFLASDDSEGFFDDGGSESDWI